MKNWIFFSLALTFLSCTEPYFHGKVFRKAIFQVSIPVESQDEILLIRDKFSFKGKVENISFGFAFHSDKHKPSWNNESKNYYCEKLYYTQVKILKNNEPLFSYVIDSTKKDLSCYAPNDEKFIQMYFGDILLEPNNEYEIIIKCKKENIDNLNFLYFELGNRIRKTHF